MRAALRAGIQEATAAIATNKTAIAANVDGSAGLTPTSMAPMTRVRPRAAVQAQGCRRHRRMRRGARATSRWVSSDDWRVERHLYQCVYSCACGGGCASGGGFGSVREIARGKTLAENRRERVAGSVLRNG